MSKYYLTHDENFMKQANLKHFDSKILDICGKHETNFLFELIKDAPKDAIILDIGAFNGDTSITLSNMLKNVNRQQLHQKE